MHTIGPGPGGKRRVSGNEKREVAAAAGRSERPRDRLAVARSEVPVHHAEAGRQVADDG